MAVKNQENNIFIVQNGGSNTENRLKKPGQISNVFKLTNTNKRLDNIHNHFK